MGFGGFGFAQLLFSSHGIMMIGYDYSIDISILLDYLTARANMNMVLVVFRQSR